MQGWGMSEWFLGGIQVFGFLCSAYFALVWIPAVFRARHKGLLTEVSTFGLIDFIGFPLIAFLVYSLTFYNLLTFGIDISGSKTQIIQRFAVWALLTTIVTIRAAYWTLRWSRTPASRIPPRR